MFLYYFIRVSQASLDIGKGEPRIVSKEIIKIRIMG